MALAAQRRWIMPIKAGDVPDGIPALVAQVLACRGLAPAEMAAFIKEEAQRWSDVIKKNNIVVD